MARTRGRHLSETCWICGAKSDSAEHRFKKADIVRAHGRGPYVGASALSHVRDGKASVVQGPSSKSLKYPPSLCRHCNTTYTQPFDRAYDALVSWTMANEEAVLRRRFIDFEEVYGVGWEDSQRDLYKYFTKSFGCRLVDASYSVPRDLVELLGLLTFRTRLRLTIAVNEDILLMSKSDRDGFIGKGDLFAPAPNSASGSTDSFAWNEHVSWLTIFYWYNCGPEGAYGSTWIADSKFVYLGSFAPLDEHTRNEYIGSVKTRDRS